MTKVMGWMALGLPTGVVGKLRLLLSSRMMLLNESATKRCAVLSKARPRGPLRGGVESGLAHHPATEVSRLWTSDSPLEWAADDLEAGGPGDEADDVVRAGLGDEERLHRRDGQAVGVVYCRLESCRMRLVEALADGSGLCGRTRCNTANLAGTQLLPVVSDVEVAADVPWRGD